MKIIMTLMGLEIGGAETHVVELAKGLHRRGHTVIIASNGGVYEAALAEASIRHVKIPMHRRDIGCMTRSLVLLEKLIREEKPDLVHSHARISAFLCGILHARMGFPFITTAHWVFTVTPLLRLMSNWGQRTVAVSEDIKTYLMESYGVPPDQIHVTINAIDTETFAPGNRDAELARALGLGSGPIIGHISRLDQSRELAARELIGLMPRLLRIHPDAQLLIVGGGDMAAELNNEAEAVNRHAGRNAVIMAGPRTDIARFVGLCDVFVGVSRAALEAISAEKPTILAGTEGYIGLLTPQVLPQAQDSNFCCRGFGSIDPDQLLSDLLNLLAMDEDRRAALGDFGRKLILGSYSVERMVQDYLDAYEALLHPEPVIRAAISGYYGFDNLGDDALLYAISSQLAQLPKTVRLTVLSNNPTHTIRDYGLLAVPRFSPIALYRTLRSSDILISGGGSLLQNKTSTRSLLYYLAVIRLAKWLKKPVFLYANGIGPLIGEQNCRKVRRCLERCDVITLRDHQSLEELRSIGLTHGNIHVTSDPAFALKPTAEPGAGQRELGIPDGARVIGISVRNLPDNANFPEQFARLCDRLSAELGMTIVFLVMQESEDEPISRRIQSMMREPSFLAKTPGDPGAMLSLIRDMELLVSMRLHSVIFAAAVSVPVVGCVYDPKVQAFLDTLSLPSCGTPREVEADHAFDTVVSLLNDREAVCHRLSRTVSELTAQTEITADLLMQLLKQRELM